MSINTSQDSNHSFRGTEWGRYIAAIVVAVLVSLIIADVRTTSAQREGCERRQVVFKEVNKLIGNVARDLERDPNDEIRVRVSKTYRDAYIKIDQNIVRDCNKAYPHVVPFVE